MEFEGLFAPDFGWSWACTHGDISDHFPYRFFAPRHTFLPLAAARHDGSQPLRPRSAGAGSVSGDDGRGRAEVHGASSL